MNFQQKDKSNKAVPIFQVEKKHGQRNRLLRFFEVLVIFLVVIGTIVWVLAANKFSFGDFVADIADKIRPKTSTSAPTRQLSKEEQIRQLVSKNSLFEIVSTTKTAEGDFEVLAKDGLIVVFSGIKDLEQQLSTLQTLLTKAKIDNKSLKKVDFRFDKTVVVY